jgi:hypothetical protein
MEPQTGLNDLSKNDCSVQTDAVAISEASQLQKFGAHLDENRRDREERSDSPL